MRFLALYVRDVSKYQGKALPSGTILGYPILEKRFVANRRACLPLGRITLSDKLWMRNFLDTQEIPYQAIRFLPKNWRWISLLKEDDQ